jgi:hypothetical protein
MGIIVCSECKGDLLIKVPEYCVLEFRNPYAIVTQEICPLCEGWGFVDCSDKEICKKQCHLRETKI